MNNVEKLLMEYDIELNKLNDRIKRALKLIESYELGKYDYSIPMGGIIELKDILKGETDE